MPSLKLGFLVVSSLFFSCLPSPGYGAPLGSYVVQPGDCLWKIAARHSVYGSPWRWPLIYDANPGIVDPELIRPGWRLDYPLEPSAEQVLVAVEEARQYQGPAQAPPPQPPMAVGDLRIMDDSLPAEGAAPGSFLGREAWTGILLLGLAVFSGLLLLAYGLVPLFLAWTRSHEPALKTEGEKAVEAGEGPMAETAIAVPEEAPLPQPTESEAIVRAMEGPDPDEGVLVRPLEAKDFDLKKAEEEHKEEEKLAA